MAPVAGDEFAHSVQHRAGRTEPERRQDREPGQHAEHMAVRGQHGVFDDVAHDLAAWQLAHVHPLPLREQLARKRLVSRIERVANAGEVVAELAEPQRDVEHGDAPQHGNHPAGIRPAAAGEPPSRRAPASAPPGSTQSTRAAACRRRSSRPPSGPSRAGPRESGWHDSGAAPARSARRTGSRKSSWANHSPEVMRAAQAARKRYRLRSIAAVAPQMKRSLVPSM